MRNKNLFRKDHISDLPQGITEAILTKLPLRDAVRTSILSSKWRYKWATLTNLVFNDECVSGTRDRSLAKINLEKFITRFLFLHDGPINRFALSTAYLQSSPDINQWLLFLSRKDVKELVLYLGIYGWFRAPCCLFSCQKLVHLKIVNGELDPPLSFKGFPFLKHLNLRQVIIASDAIQNLISGCPLLESLKLSFYDALELTIRAPNLKNLILEGEFTYLCLENTPKLVAMYVNLHMTNRSVEHFGQSLSCNFDKFLGGALSLERFIGRAFCTLYMSIGNTKLKTQMKFQQLKVIELYKVSLQNIKEVMVVLRLILNAPNLQELQISGVWDSLYATEAPNLDLWENECPSDSIFERLKRVKMTDLFGLPHEIRLIGFLLGSSPVFKTMSITPGVTMAEDRSSFLIELLRFKRASTEAEIIFVKDHEV